MEDIKSLSDLRKRFSTEVACRRLMEKLIWPNGRFCPHCGSLRSWPIHGTARPGLYECADCSSQFTVTTKTPLHATKLPLSKWLEAMYLILTSSKGITSVFMAQILGINQKSAWKMNHAIRELMDNREEEAPALSGIVEADETFVGGRPKFKRGIKNKRGKGTKKQPVFIAIERGGEVRAAVIPFDTKTYIVPKLMQFVDPSAVLMTDGSLAYTNAGAKFAAHHTVNHGKKQFALNDVHINTSEGFAAMLERAQFGVFHWTSKHYLQRYVDEMVFRWNMRCRYQDETKCGYKKPFIGPLSALLSRAVGRQLRRTRTWSLRWPDPIGPGYIPFAR